MGTKVSPLHKIKSHRHMLWPPNLVQIYTSIRWFRKHVFHGVTWPKFDDAITFFPKNAYFIWFYHIYIYIYIYIYISKDLSSIKIFIFWLLQFDSIENSLNIRKMFFVCVTDHFSSFRFWQRKMFFLCVLLTILVPSGFDTYGIPRKFVMTSWLTIMTSLWKI